MTIHEHADVFYELPVQDFTDAHDWHRLQTAYRISITWDDSQETLIDKLDNLTKQKNAARLKALIIGAWTGEDSAASSATVIDALVERKDAFPDLRALFLGDIICEENEVSWIQQSNVSPLLKAYPSLELLRLRGSNGLEFSKVRHDALNTLIIETGGLPRSLVREIGRCEFPNLEHLELWLGVSNYGWDGGPEDLQPLLAGKWFPKLEYLGLRNSEIADEIAAVVVNAPIVQRLKVLDLSNGTLSDAGARALLGLADNTSLTTLNLCHHYMTEEMVVELQETLPFEVIADDGQDPEEEWRGVVVSE